MSIGYPDKIFIIEQADVSDPSYVAPWLYFATLTQPGADAKSLADYIQQLNDQGQREGKAYRSAEFVRFVLPYYLEEAV